MSSPTATSRLYDMLDQGLVTHEQVVLMCLGFMSDDDVAKMMDNNELSERFDEEPDEEDEIAGEVDSSPK